MVKMLNLNVGIHTKTKEEFLKVLSWCRKNLKYCEIWRGTKYWEEYKENTYINLNGGHRLTFGNVKIPYPDRWCKDIKPIGYLNKFIW
jgi:hypothetical protein